MVGAFVSASNRLQMAYSGETHLTALCRDFSVRLEPIFCIISLTSLFTCSLYRSQGIFIPKPPLVLTNLCHMIWCDKLGERTFN